jgi:hypothetical protein
VLIATSVVVCGTGVSACSSSSSGGAPTTGSHGSSAADPNGSKTFSRVNAKDASKLEVSLPTAAGVRTVTYYKKAKKLQVFFRGATANDQQAVVNLVTQR